MTEPYIAKRYGLLQPSPTVVSTPWRHGWRCTLRRLASVLLVTGLCGSTLTGCGDFWDTTSDLLRLDGGGDAEAQDQTETRVKTYVINTDGFEIVLDNDSDLTPILDEASDSSTKLTMESEGAIVRGTGDANIALEMGDVVILRLNGSTGSVTLIRRD